MLLSSIWTALKLFILFILSISVSLRGFSEETSIPEEADVILLGHRMIEGSQFHFQLSHMIKELSDRTRIEFQLLELPNLRSLTSANDGVTGGEISRVRSLAQNPKFPNLRLVDAPWSEASLKAIGIKNMGIDIKGWESIRNYSFCYRQGMIFVERKMEAYNIRGDYHEKPMQTLMHIQLGRCDVTAYWYGHLGPQELSFMAEHNIEPIFHLQTVNGHMYLHKKHEHLIPVIREAMVDMANDGTRAKIFEESKKISHFPSMEPQH